jgi:hypothetical protein
MDSHVPAGFLMRLPSMRTLFMRWSPLIIPFLLYLTARFCGREGIVWGRVFCSVFPISILGLACYFGIRAGLSLRQSYSTTGVNLVAVLICVATFVLSLHRKPFLEGFEGSLKRVYAVSEIQPWAIDVLNSARENKVIKRAEYPPWATDNRFTRPDGIYVVANDANGEGGYLKLSWGSGAIGQWGLILGPPTLSRRGRSWAPGVYFFVVPKPYGWRE